jgi:phosphate starvation-inducible PhoH-like protein
MSKYREKNQQQFQIELEARSEHQAEYVASILRNVVTVGLGFAGTGKTYIASTLAAQFKNKEKHGRVVLCRPNVSDSKSIGSLPGDTLEKMSPWIQPYTSVLKQHLGDERVDADMRKGTIEVCVFEHMQGRTFDDAFVILDEAQHTTPKEMEMFLKRVGVNTTVIVCGDIAQSRLGPKSGLKQLLDMSKDGALPEMKQVGFVEFDNPDDIVRSEFCRDITMAYDRFHTMKEAK